MSNPKEVFLSHATPDTDFTRHLAGVLGDHGIPSWYSERNILGAKQWHDEIGAALARCDWFILVFTEAATKSKWVKRELLYALQQDRYEDRVVPLILDSTDTSRLSWVIDSLQKVDFQQGLAEGYTKLFRIWGISYAE